MRPTFIDGIVPKWNNLTSWVGREFRDARRKRAQPANKIENEKNGANVVPLAAGRIAGSNAGQQQAGSSGPQRRHMSEQTDGQLASPRDILSLDPIALKWRNLAERRRAHLVDLYRTGRWKRYYSEEKFLACFRETMSMAERWNEIAPKGEGEEPTAS